MELIITVLRNTKGSDDYMILNSLDRNTKFNIINFDDQKWVDYHTSIFITRIFRFLFRKINQRALNIKIQKTILKFNPSYFLVFKGVNISESTIKIAKKKNVKTILIYPDLDPANYGSKFLDAISQYDHLYHTKPNLIDYFKKFNKNVEFIYPFIPSLKCNNINDYDENIGVLFVGHFSREKHKKISAFINKYQEKITLVGRGWDLYEDQNNVNVLGELYGDMNIDLYSKSLVVLGLLQESISKNNDGDVITSRTFLVPFSGGLLLHEDNLFVREIYGKNELYYFSNSDDLVAKVKKIKNQNLREFLWSSQKESIVKNATDSNTFYTKYL